MDKKLSNNCMVVTLSEMLYSRSQKVNEIKFFICRRNQLFLFFLIKLIF